LSDRLPNVERANRYLAAAWKAGILTEPVIDTAALECAALGKRDRSAFGSDGSWREAFHRLVAALRDEADLSPLGRTMAHSQIVHLLRARIATTRLLAEAPQATQTPMPPPIIIVGQMRSGTTRVQRLLSCDHRLAHTKAFETLTPIPSPGRRFRARTVLTAIKLLNPETLRIHPTHPQAPDEEFGFLAYGFGPAQFEAQWQIPSFSRWWESADKSDLYRDFDQLVRMNRSARDENPAKSHIFKLPQFCEDLPAILQTYPGAKLIALGRDTDQVVASSASLVWNHMRIQSNSIDKHWVGQEWLRKTRLRQALLDNFVSNRPDVLVIHVDYERMNRDWLGEMERIYAFLGRDLPPALVHKMERWLQSSRTHLGHRYSLDEFGLAPTKVSRAGMALAG
jgi:hypothetical protein